jgi:hypothetical protein
MQDEIKPRIAMSKTTIKRKTPFTRKLDLNLWKKLLKYYSCRIVLCCVETWTLRKVSPKYERNYRDLKGGDGEGWKSADPIVSEVGKSYLQSRKRGISYIIQKEERLIGFVTSSAGNLLKYIIEEKL